MKKRIFSVLSTIIWLAVVTSMGINLGKQWGNLLRAYRKTSENRDRITTLTEENRILSEKIKYSTESAYLDQQVRDKLGLGDPDDYWLKLGEEEDIDLYPGLNEVVKKPAWRQWWELFGG